MSGGRRARRGCGPRPQRSPQRRAARHASPEHSHTARAPAPAASTTGTRRGHQSAQRSRRRKRTPGPPRTRSDKTEAQRVCAQLSTLLERESDTHTQSARRHVRAASFRSAPLTRDLNAARKSKRASRRDGERGGGGGEPGGSARGAAVAAVFQRDRLAAPGGWIRALSSGCGLSVCTRWPGCAVGTPPLLRAGATNVVVAVHGPMEVSAKQELIDRAAFDVRRRCDPLLCARVERAVCARRCRSRSSRRAGRAGRRKCARQRCCAACCPRSSWVT